MPEQKIELRTMSTESQERLIMSGILDVGFLRSWVRETKLVFEPIGEESLVLIFPSSFTLGSDPSECLAALANKPFIKVSTTYASGLSEFIRDAVADYGVSVSAAYECNDAFSIIGLVSNGLGWSVVPDLEMRNTMPKGIRVLAFPNRKITIGMCYRDSDLAPHAEQFIRIAKAYFSR
jgi:DNA-binding transcriptional LysR family regulator